MTYDTITLNGVEKTFADWNIDQSNLHASFKNQAADTLQISLTNQNIADEADAPTCAFESQAVIRVNRTGAGTTWSGGTIKFVGKRVQPPLKASGSGHTVSYMFHGPWYDLANSDYQQIYKGGDGNTYYLPETVLFSYMQVFSFGSTVSYYGLISAGEQIQSILKWVLDQYVAQGLPAPFQFKGTDHTNAPTVNVNGYGGFFTWPAQPGMTIESSLYSLFLPTLIQKPMKASTSIQKCLEMSPRINFWFDYTTVDNAGNPLPTAMVTLVDNMPAVNVPLFTGFQPGGVTHKDIDIQARDDLMIRAVRINYRITGTFNGEKMTSYVTDKYSASGFGYYLPELVGNASYPNASSGSAATDPNSGLRVLNDLIDLQGTNTTTQKGHIDVEPILATSFLAGTTAGTSADQAAKRQWWSLKRGGEVAKLEDSRVRFQTFVPNLTNPLSPTLIQTYIPDAIFYDATTGAVLAPADLIAAGLCDASGNLVLNRLVQGTYQPWMTRRDGQPIVTLKVKMSAKMVFAEYTSLSTSGTPDTDTAGDVSKRSNSSDEHVNIEVTNAVPDTGSSGYANFAILASIQPGECFITGAGGIANYLWNHLKVRQFDGNYCKVEADFINSSASGYLNLGKKLNLTNGAAIWQTMNAQIQEIVENYGARETTVKIGVAKHLNAGQLSSLLNMWRNRRTWFNPAVQTQPAGGIGSTIDSAKATGQANTTHGLQQLGQAQHLDYPLDSSGNPTGAPATGVINHDPALITNTLAAIVAGGKTPTPIGPDDIKTMQPRKCKLCDDAGNLFYAMVHTSGGWTEV